MTTRMRRSTLTYRSGGWTAHLCNTQNVAPCSEPAVWRTERRGRGYVATGYYCQRHLPAGYRTAGPTPDERTS